MYNFGLEKDEELVYVFDDIYVKLNDRELNTTIAVTTKRLLFLDYNNEYDDLRVANYQTYIKYKEVYSEVLLSNVEKISNYKLELKNGLIIVFKNKKIIELVCKEVRK